MIEASKANELTKQALHNDIPESYIEQTLEQISEAIENAAKAGRYTVKINDLTYRDSKKEYSLVNYPDIVKALRKAGYEFFHTEGYNALQISWND